MRELEVKATNCTLQAYNCNCLEFLPKIQDKKICIVTDPPFNIGYKYNSYNDNLPDDEYYGMLETLFKGHPFCIIHYPEAIYALAVKMGIVPERVISWVYNSNTKRQHRDIAFFGITPDFSKVKQPYKNLNDIRIQERMANGDIGTDMYDWFYVNQVKNVSEEKTEHPCQMPLEVMKKVVGVVPDDYIIFDPFMGSGTTAVACYELKRDFIGTEIDSMYFDISCDRINQAYHQISFDDILSDVI